MQQLLKDIAAGIASGVLTYAASIYALGVTNAFVMPQGFPLVLWQAVVVFGTGATLVALLLHLLAIRVFAAKSLPAFVAFAAAGVVALATSGLMAHGGKAIAAWLVGAVLASLAHRRLGPDKSFKPKPLRSA